MLFHSTGGQEEACTLSHAIMSGLASDGGLYVPDQIPVIDWASCDVTGSYADFAVQVLAPFFKDDKLSVALKAICTEAFTFPTEMVALDEGLHVMELFHGPTVSFKDYGCRFLAGCLNQLASNNKLTVMVATSGDTGSAVAAAFHDKPNVNVIVLYPKGRVTPRQAHQISCWGDNVLSLCVDGSFDDCQRLVKAALSDNKWQESYALTTSNSINIARLLPQIVFYAYTSCQYMQAYNKMPGYIVPSGNLGNITAAFWAKAMGFPMREIAMATNANTVMSDFISQGTFTPRASVATLATAMDVGAPSNVERLMCHFSDWEMIKDHMSVYSVSDAQIQKAIVDCHQAKGYVMCPHTATAMHAYQQVGSSPWIVAATAHPSKFEQVIHPLLNQEIAIAPQLQQLLKRSASVIEVAADLDTIRKTCDTYFSHVL